MKKAILVAALVAVVTAVAVARSGGATTGPSQIRITDVQVEYRQVLSGGQGRIGDMEVIRQRLYNPSISERPIGRGYLLCTFVNDRSRQCTATYLLPRGKIVVAGALDSRLFYELAVTGGTGLYDNARGTLTVTSTGLKPRRDVLLFRLAG
jgi:hypothetical protein